MYGGSNNHMNELFVFHKGDEGQKDVRMSIINLEPEVDQEENELLLEDQPSFRFS